MNTNYLPQSAATSTRPTVKPEFSVTTGEAAYEVQVFLPSVTRDETKVSLEDNVLTVEASRNRVVPEGRRVIRREIADVDYRLRLNLGRDVNSGGIQAEVQNGVLQLTLPKADEVKPRQIQIA